MTYGVGMHTPASCAAVSYRVYSWVWFSCALCCNTDGGEGLTGQLHSFFRGPQGLFTTDPSVTDNHLAPMSIAHKCLCSSSLCSHLSGSALGMYSIWDLAADVARTQQQKQHTATRNKTCLLNSSKNAAWSSIGHDATIWRAIHIIKRVRGPLFNPVLADGLVFDRGAYPNTPASQSVHSIWELGGWSSG